MSREPLPPCCAVIELAETPIEPAPDPYSYLSAGSIAGSFPTRHSPSRGECWP